MRTSRHLLSKILTGPAPRVMLSALVLAGLLAGGAFSQQDSLAGDADGNGTLNVFDLEAILAQILGDAEEAVDADANEDGKVDIADWVALQEFLFPSDLSRYESTIELMLDSDSLTPGESVTATWVIADPARSPAVDLYLRIREPGAVVLGNGERTFTPGIVPPNGNEFFRTPQQQWSETETVLTSSIDPSELTFELPAETEGEWLIELQLRSQGSGDLIAIGQQTLVVTSRPAMRLTLNRPIANANDYVQLELDTFAGTEEQDVVVVGQLLLSDGSVWPFPTEGPDGALPILEGPARRHTIPLINRHFNGFEEGLYRAEIKMFAAEGGLLALSNAAFEICEGAVPVRGTVGNLGELSIDDTVVASIRAFDIDDASGPAAAVFASDGTYELMLDPGRYLLRSLVTDADAVRAAETPLVVPCGSDAIDLDLSLEALQIPTDQDVFSGRSARRSHVSVSGGLPNPKVYLVPTTDGLTEGEAALLKGSILIKLGQTHPDVDFSDPGDISVMLQLSETSSFLGDSETAEQRIQEAADALGTDIVAPVGISLIREDNDQGGEDCRLAVRIPFFDNEGNPIETFDRTLESQGCDLAQLSNDLDDAIENDTPQLATRLAAALPVPIVPTLKIVADREVARPGEMITATVTLEEIDGEPTPDRDVTIEHASDTGGFASREGVTDANGQFEATLPVFANSTVGILAARYNRRARIWHSNDVFYNVLPSDATQSMRIVEPTPAASLKPGETTTIRVEVRSTVSGIPVPQLGGIEASAVGGTVSPTQGSTDSQGIAAFTFTAGDDNGRGKVTVQRLIGGSGDPQLIQTTWNIAITSDAVLNVTATEGSGSSLSIGPQVAVDPNRAIAVMADLRVGDDRIPGLPVRFSLTGEGAVAAIDTSTDEFGLADSFFVPPLVGEGTSEMCATTVVDGSTIEDCVDIDYAFNLQFESVYLDGLRTDQGPVPFHGWPPRGALNNKGQVVAYGPASSGFGTVGLWLPEPAYGLPAGLSLPQCTFPSEGGGTVTGNCGGGGTDINDSGKILMGSSVVWDSGAMTVLGDATARFQLNNQGQTAGWDVLSADPPEILAFRETVGGPRQVLNPGPGHQWSQAWGINENGDVVGKVSQVDDTDNEETKRIALWPAGSNTPQYLSGSLPRDSNSTTALDVNESGQVLVGSRGGKNWVWDNGTVIDLPDTPGFGQALAINNNGIVVGCDGIRAQIWLEGEKVPLSPLVVDPPGQIFTCAIDVNEDGWILAMDENLELWLLKPR